MFGFGKKAYPVVRKDADNKWFWEIVRKSDGAVIAVSAIRHHHARKGEVYAEIDDLRRLGKTEEA